jgi:hypothetical protein
MRQHSSIASSSIDSSIRFDSRLCPVPPSLCFIGLIANCTPDHLFDPLELAARHFCIQDNELAPLLGSVALDFASVRLTWLVKLRACFQLLHLGPPLLSSLKLRT